MVASMRLVARRSSAGVSWKPLGSRASGPLFLFDLAMIRCKALEFAALIADCPHAAKQGDHISIGTLPPR